MWPPTSACHAPYQLAVTSLAPLLCICIAHPNPFHSWTAPHMPCGLILRPIFLVAANAANCLVAPPTAPRSTPPSYGSAMAQHFSNFPTTTASGGVGGVSGQFLPAARNFCSWRLDKEFPERKREGGR